MRKTKIVCTIGPTSDSLEIMKNLIEAGMNVARLNFSHGTHEEHEARIKRLRQAAAETQQVLAIMLDTKGPEIRTGYMQGDRITLKEGLRVMVTTVQVDVPRSRLCQESVVLNSYPFSQGQGNRRNSNTPLYLHLPPFVGIGTSLGDAASSGFTAAFLM
jgi:pyruvate kinase